jgi:uncharacterized membrane protein
LGIIDDPKRWVELGIADESKRWVELEIIDDDAREKILALYHKKRPTIPISVLFAVLGTLLLGLGVILIFATNWENIPRNLKLCVSFVPMIIAMGVFLFTLIKKRDSAAFREGAALGLTLSIFANIALIDQIFQIPSDTLTYLRICMFLSLPAIYLLDAKSPAAIYVICATVSGFAISLPFALLSAAAIAPFLIWQIMKTNQKTVIWYLSLLSGTLLAFLVYKISTGWYASGITVLACAVFLLALDALIVRQKKIVGFMPLTPLSYLMIIFMLMISSFRGTGIYTPPFFGSESLILLFAAVILYAAVRFYKQRIEIKAADALVLCALLGFPLHWLWSNVLLAVLSIWFIAVGVRNLNIKVVNYGMLLLIFLIAMRFFDSGLGLMERGVAFIVIGLGFILANLLLYRKRKMARHEKEEEEDKGEENENKGGGSQ